MVNGHEKVKPGTRILAVDLDGTFIKGNSLHEYIKAGIIVSWKKRQLVKLIKLFTYLSLRKLHLISHVNMKFGCAAIIKDDPETLKLFKQKINSIKSEDVEKLIKEYEEAGCKTLIATAALDIYLKTFLEYEYIATKTYNNPKKVELRGDNKVIALKEWLKEHQCILQAVITDHIDDLPLLLMNCPDKYLINTKDQFITKYPNNKYHQTIS